MTDKRDRQGAKAATNATSSSSSSLASTVTGVLLVALVLMALMWFVGGSDDTPERSTDSAEKSKGPKITKLAESSTYTALNGVPTDPAPQANTDGSIVHPRLATKLYAAPNGKAIGRIKPTQLGDTWLPAIAKQRGWVRVLLPSKPNGSTAWIRDNQLEHAFTPYVIRVHLGSKRMELFFEERVAGSWTIGIGKPDTPTPTGRTFLLGSIVDPNQKYSPVILPLGAHSATLDSFGGGPGTVAIHTWPTTDVLGAATSHGCIRVPKDALDRLTEVPLGTLVLVDQQ